jgi:hypothetical protein
LRACSDKGGGGNRCEASQRRKGRPTLLENHGDRGERQLVPSRDAAGCADRTSKISRNIESRGEHPTGEIANRHVGHEEAAASSGGYCGGGGHGAQ